MAKLTRVTGKVFGATASPTGDANNGPYIGQFGSAKTGEYTGTGDVATIQAKSSAWANGWIDAVTPTNQYPSLPERTGVDKVLSYQECYILQQGIPEWDSATDYHINCFCSQLGTIYYSLVDNNVNHSPIEDTDNAYWEEYAPSVNQDPYLVTANINGSTWYRVYSDGWKEQGGSITSGSSEYSWGFIPLTSNGVMGQDAFAVDSSVIYNSNYPAYKAFDGTTSGAKNGWWSKASVPVHIEFYSSTPIRVTNLNIQNYGGASTTLKGYFASKAGAVYGSNDGVNWTQIKQYTNNTVTYGEKWNINLSDNTNYYNYYRITSTQISGTYNNEGWYIQEMKITAYAQGSGGGTSNVLYPFSFNDTNYTALLTAENASSNGLYVASKTSSGLVLGNAPSGKTNWYVCGY